MTQRRDSLTFLIGAWFVDEQREIKRPPVNQCVIVDVWIVLKSVSHLSLWNLTGVTIRLSEVGLEVGEDLRLFPS
jgi:hypothetical protein